ncbi:alpha/beta hydrolase [Gloeobacter morelensis]|uniref:Alpha/beta hydrolase n=1 Tax=Gloeobacter morelensis MG652769 TaxID=2781736 RepID=A0ABY3PRU6_9CYAN|nr:alpha/beta hydrolase [Gloeobacter morelensis]UFP96327.1 alpha/beta hydrolase [Gloeobacter morelensis MG652769]
MAKMEALVIENRRAQQLVGVLHHGEGTGPRPCLVVCHGFAGTKVGGSRRFVNFARYATGFGLSVLRFDFAGCGDSDGELAELTLEGELDDLRAAIATVRAWPSVDSERIGVVGHCLGAVTAIRACARGLPIARAVAWAPFADLPGTLERLIGEAAFALVREGEIADFLYNQQLFQCGPDLLSGVDGFDLKGDIELVHQPLLIVHGSEDATVPLAEVEGLIEAARPTPGLRRLEVIEGAHHSFPYHQEELFDLTVQWFRNW